MSNRDTFLRRWVNAPPGRGGRPRWLSRTIGERVSGYFNLWGDLLAEAARQSVRWRYPDGDTPTTMVARAGVSRGLPRLGSEPADLYLERIRDHWDGHRLAATPDGLHDLFSAAGIEAYASVTTWSDYEVVVYGYACTGAVDWDDFQWGDGTVWGGGPASLEAISLVREVCLSYAPAHMQLVSIRCPLRDDAAPDLTNAWVVGDSPSFPIPDTIGSADLSIGPPISGTVATAETGTLYVIAEGFAGPIDQPDPEDQCLVSLSTGGDPIDLYWRQGATGLPRARASTLSVVEGPRVDAYPKSTRCLAMAWNGSSVSLYIDGIRVRQGILGSAVASTGTINVGVRANGTDGFRGTIHELGYTTDIIGGDDIARLTRYARDRYGAAYAGPEFPTHPKA